MKVDFISILISETIGILITVFLVDKIIAWRQKKKWNDARFMFLSYGKRQSDEIIKAWKEWLVGMSKVKEIKIMQKNQVLLTGMGYYPLDTGIMVILKSYIGDPIGSNLDKVVKYRNPQRDTEIIKCLVPYLTQIIYSQSEEDWNYLGGKLKNPVDKLSELVGRYSSLVDPKFAASVLRLSIEVDNILESKYTNDTKSNEASFVNYLAKASVIGYGIGYSLQLCDYVNKYNK